MKQNSKVIHEKYEFRNIHKDEIEQAAEIESICFPPNEACTYEHMESRIKKSIGSFSGCCGSGDRQDCRFS